MGGTGIWTGTGAGIEVGAWTDLDALVAAMGEVGVQQARATSYAVGRVCRPDGFATGPVCLLRPLAEVLEAAAQAFADAGRLWGDDWHRVLAATAASARELRAGDRHAARLSGAVLARLERAQAA